MRHTYYLVILLTAFAVTGLPVGIDTTTARADEPNLTTAVTDVAQNVGPAVVAIQTQQRQSYRTYRRPYRSQYYDEDFFRQFFSDFFGATPQEEYRQLGMGSGVIIHEDGYILTNAHVVWGADRIVVRLPDGREFAGELKGIDTRSDLAVIKIDAPHLPVAALGDSGDLRIGQWVVAIGNPFGQVLHDPEPAVTTGVISALHRALPGTSIQDTDYSDLIQTDAAINPGNSGGPLVNLKGEVVGINVAIFTTTGGYQGIGFAIPISYAKVIVQKLVEGKKVEYGWMGVSVQDLNPRLAQYFNLTSLEGVLVLQVIDGSPADKAGLKEGDIILTVNNVKIRNSVNLIRYIFNAEVDDTLEVDILRNNVKKSLQVRIAKRPQEADLLPGDGEEDTQPTQTLTEWRGITVETITAQAADEFGVSPQSVRVAGISPDSPAYQGGLRQGDIILGLNQRAVKNIKQFYRLAGKMKGDCLVKTHRGYFVVAAP